MFGFICAMVHSIIVNTSAETGGLKKIMPKPENLINFFKMMQVILPHNET